MSVFKPTKTVPSEGAIRALVKERDEFKAEVVAQRLVIKLLSRKLRMLEAK